MAGLCVLTSGVAYLLQDRLVYAPDSTVISLAAKMPGGVDVTYRTSDGLTLHGWWIRGQVGPGDRPPTVVAFHGRAGNRTALWRMARDLAGEGVSVFLAEYRGYGESAGSPSEDGLAIDARAAVDYVKSRHDVDPTKVVYFGESLGTGVAVRLATERPPSGLVLVSPFTSLPDAASVHIPVLPLDELMHDQFDSIHRVPKLDVPLLVVAGTSDNVVPIQQSRAVFAAAPRPDRFVEIDGVGHHDRTLFAGQRVVGEVSAFARRCVGVDA